MYQISTTTVGMLCALSAVISTALYQLWAGSQQRALDASSAQLLHQSSPYAAGLLAILVVVFEPVLPSSDPARGEICDVLYGCASFDNLLTANGVMLCPCVTGETGSLFQLFFKQM